MIVYKSTYPSFHQAKLNSSCSETGRQREGSGDGKTFARGAYARLKACYRYCKQWNSLRRNQSYSFRKHPRTGCCYWFPRRSRPAQNPTFYFLTSHCFRSLRQVVPELAEGLSDLYSVIKILLFFSACGAPSG